MKPSRETIRRALILLAVLLVLFLLFKYPAHPQRDFPATPSSTKTGERSSLDTSPSEACAGPIESRRCRIPRSREADGVRVALFQTTNEPPCGRGRARLGCPLIWRAQALFRPSIASVEDRPTQSGSLDWAVTVTGGASLGLRFQLLLPDVVGHYELTSTVKVAGVSIGSSPSLVLEVTRAVEGALGDAIAALEATDVPGNR
jgi:hypothetical protein